MKNKKLLFISLGCDKNLVDSEFMIGMLTSEGVVLCDDETEAGSDEILLGAGTYLLDDVEVGLTRGGGKFTVEREIREINADGDRGAVKGRVVMEGSRAKLEFNALTMLTKLSTIYPAIGTSV